MECEPTASVLVTNIAWPEPSRVPVPRGLEPSLKVTVPVGVPAPGLFAVTVAVKVTGCPDTEGLAEEVTPVVVPGIVVVVVVDVDVVVVVVDVLMVLVGVGDVVEVVVEAPAGLKVASTMFQLVAVPKVRLPSCGPSALDRMSSSSEASLPFCTSMRYGTIWLLPGVAQRGWPPVMTAATTSSPAGIELVGPTLAWFPTPCATTARSSAPTVATCRKSAIASCR